ARACRVVRRGLRPAGLVRRAGSAPGVTRYRGAVRNLLRPGWLTLTLVVISFAIACFTLLSPWQFRRNAERETTNDRITAAVQAPPEPLHAGMAEWRLATVTGSFVPDDEIIARLRTVQG